MLFKAVLNKPRSNLL